MATFGSLTCGVRTSSSTSYVPSSSLRERLDVKSTKWLESTVNLLVAITSMGVLLVTPVAAKELPKATIDGTGPGWKELRDQDFANVNCEPETWSWHKGILSCTGQPTGVLRSRKEYTNFELVLQWKHQKTGGNSGVFVWGTAETIEKLKPNEYPQGVEIQILDHGYTKEFEATTGERADWFTTEGDVFPVNGTRMKPFPPVSPNGERSFPRKQLTKGLDHWNHYYIRCLNGEVRLWVNGEEVSGGTDCNPRTGYLCLESEGAPIQFTQIRVRELP